MTTYISLAAAITQLKNTIRESFKHLSEEDKDKIHSEILNTLSFVVENYADKVMQDIRTHTNKNLKQYTKTHNKIRKI